MHDADKKIPDWRDADLQEHFPDLYTSHDQSRPWRAILAGAIIGLIGVLLFVVMSACAPLPHDDGMGDLWKGVRYMEQRR